MVCVKAVGAYIYDARGNRYIDYNAAFGLTILGRALPSVTKRVTEFLVDFDNVGVGVSTLEIELARKLVRDTFPSGEKNSVL